MIKFFIVFFFPLIELYGLIKLGSVIGGFWTVLLVVFSGLCGVALLQYQGKSAFLQMQDELRQGKVPQLILLERVLLFLAALLLIMPGIISDALALLLLIPWLRNHIAAYFAKRFTTTYGEGGAHAFYGGNGMFFYSSSGQSGGFTQPGSHEGEQDTEVIIDCVATDVEEAHELSYDCTAHTKDSHQANPTTKQTDEDQHK